MSNDVQPNQESVIVQDLGVNPKPGSSGKKSWMTMQRRHIAEAYGFLSFWLIGLVCLFLFPLVFSFILSFSDSTKLIDMQFNFIGFQNYIDAFRKDITFVPALLTTLQTTVGETPLILIFSLVIALLVNRDIKGKGVFRSIFFLPVLLGTGFVMTQLLNTGVNEESLSMARGILLPAEMLAYLPESVATTIGYFFNTITIVLWKSGVQIIMFIAGLQGISQTLYESARVDSATEWEMFWKITLPILSPVLLLNFVYTIVMSFTEQSNELSEYIFRIGFTQAGMMNMAYAAAMTWVYLVIALLLIGLVFWVMRSYINRSTN